jgi:hypothetical protein
VLIDIWLAKKFLFLSELVGISDDIAPKRGFLASLFEHNWKLKRFLQWNAGGVG